MEIHSRSGGDWTFLLSKQKNWGGDVEIDSRLETFSSMRVGGVEGEKKEQMLFLEAKNIHPPHTVHQDL